MAEFTIGDIARAKRDGWLECHYESAEDNDTILDEQGIADYMRGCFLKYLKEMVADTYEWALRRGGAVDCEVVKELFDEIFAESNETTGGGTLLYTYNIETDEIDTPKEEESEDEECGHRECVCQDCADGGCAVCA